jgi:hypothetical protein
MQSVNKQTIITAPRNRVPVFGLLGFIAFFAVSVLGDDQQILEQLYQEIISSSNGTDVRDKSTSLKSGLAQPEDKENIQSSAMQPDFDQASEKLQQEIQKMVDEIKVRHDDAVKFMQDTK